MNAASHQNAGVKPNHYSSSSVHGAEFGHLPDNITVLDGESVTLRCRIDEEVTHKAWLNRSNILFTGTDKWSLDKRVTLVNSNNSDFSIHIDKVQVTDEGPYTCTFQANNKPRIAHVYLIVQDGLVSEGEFLDITEIKRQQAEDYECITNNGVARPDQRKVKVTVNYPPMITDMKNMPAHLGKTAILRCEAMAVPPASFEWYRDEHSGLTLAWTHRSKAAADISHPSVTKCTLPAVGPHGNLSDRVADGALLSSDWLASPALLRQPKCFQLMANRSQGVYLLGVIFLPLKQSLDEGITFTCTVRDHPAMTTDLTASFTWGK
ncbi:hypothetical protein F2P81_002532 [Scophthalmus maximus]|uniref:Ig-like domain-containing protein n=1 Tax=Scophthalmus maximus TaxID=52904 RepID=A0A6A4TJ17_SCOMX|nr:hypothetical protein F2P81_002532 [Scophthalmus maximus]